MSDWRDITDQVRGLSPEEINAKLLEQGREPTAKTDCKVVGAYQRVEPSTDEEQRLVEKMAER